jgi:carbon-monoxide dehydrogenase medium subunit
MEDFVFHRPRSLADALTAIRAAGEGKFLAGGQSLIPVLKLDLAQPSDLVSLASIDGLGKIEVGGDALTVGAMCTHAQVNESAGVRESITGLADLAGDIGDPAVRNRGTLGGAIAHGDPAADYPGALLALGARVKTDRRTIKADDFFTGMFETALEPDEIVTAVEFPKPEKSSYAKFPHPASKYAIVGVFVAKGREGVRVAVNGAASQVFRVTAMEQALDQNWSEDALDGISVPPDTLMSDPYASAEYRAHLVSVMARRAVATAT